MTLIEKIDLEITSALKLGNKDILSIARIVKTDLVFNTSAEKPRPEVDVLKTSKKKLTEELESFKDIAEKVEVLNIQLNWLEQFLPKMTTPEELESYWESACINEGSDFGKLMKIFKEHFGDSLDGKLASAFIKEKLT